MKKVLIINTVKFGMGGMSSVIVNYLNSMNKDELDITIIANNRIEKFYEDQMIENGVKLIVLQRNFRVFKYMNDLYRIIKNNKYDVVHIHGNSSTMAFDSIPAYLNKVSNIIVHAHNVSCKHTILNKLLWPLLKRTNTLGLACSEEAGKWLFKEKNQFEVLNNAINIEKYRFNENIRNKVRSEIGCKDSIVIGHVGYFNDQKNHEKLFQVVNYLKDKIDVQLLCISGNPEVPEHIKDMINKYEINSNIKILLRRNDVNELLQGMDLFMFPSKYEGLGLALIEAQASGLNCLVSDNVPETAAICKELINYASLNDDSEVWGQSIIKTINEDTKSRSGKSLSGIEALREAGYDILRESEKLRKIYIK